MPRTLKASRVIARFAVRLALLIGFAAFGSVGFGRSSPCCSARTPVDNIPQRAA